MGRPLSSGLTDTQRARFQSLFRSQRVLLGASNVAIGAGIDAYPLAGDVDGLTIVQNALSPSRKLTYRQARIAVVGLFLSKPGRRSEIERDRVRAATLFAREKGAFNTLAELLYASGAWADPRTELPVFVPLDVADKLAKRLVAAAVQRGLRSSETKRDTLADKLSQSLHDLAPQMARSWCDFVLRTRVARKTPQAFDFVEELARVGFADCYIAPGREASAFGPEFEVLHRERPCLTAGMAMPRQSKPHLVKGKSK